MDAGRFLEVCQGRVAVMKRPDQTKPDPPNASKCVRGGGMEEEHIRSTPGNDTHAAKGREGCKQKGEKFGKAVSNSTTNKVHPSSTRPLLPQLVPFFLNSSPSSSTRPLLPQLVPFFLNTSPSSSTRSLLSQHVPFFLNTSPPSSTRALPLTTPASHRSSFHVNLTPSGISEVSPEAANQSLTPTPSP
ncbi:hypothetical protein Pmani_034475 [Petrolisthes manimaculis]|uniref:Uncharacterized protein n=1 Tax=Petrolisthes manimaculis TaxID=1843537 RepID=A0AAE1NMN7_9EUCA|nr:hypothetical protein Pmani_034475 [Petrolisthes manimaculis]